VEKSDSKRERMEEGALLITGCPRSATRSVTKYFEDHGVSLGHETAGEKGTVDWRHAYTIMDTKNPAFIIQMTLIRNPIDTIRSLAELLTHCDRRSETWDWIRALSTLGSWDEKLNNLDFFGAATDWWITVYDRLIDFPVLKMEHLPKLPQTNRHGRIDRGFDVGGLLKGNEELWRVAEMYGYNQEDYLGDSQ